MTSEDWGQIDRLVQALFLIHSGSAAAGFAAAAEIELEEVVENEVARQALRHFAKTGFQS